MDLVDDTSGFLLAHTADFVWPSFIEHGADFDPFVDSIPGDTLVDPPQYGSLSIPGYADGGVVCSHQFSPLPEDMFGLDNPAIEGSTFILDGFLSSAENVMNGEEYDVNDEDDGDYSSAMTMNASTSSATAATPSPRVPFDRSRTLMSERRRRGRMKEKLYALRALVPNITKMDKASIVGDAVLYVQQLQMQAKKLKADIAGLEASLAGSQKHHQGQPENCLKNIHQASNSTVSIPRKILQMDMLQVEPRGFYVRLVSNRGVGVAVSLYKALESLGSSIVFQNSNLASSSSSDRFILTLTLNIKEGEPDISLPSLRMWITGSLLNQGFELVQMV